MPAKGKVDLTRQTIYGLIPILCMYSAYHVKKLIWYLLIVFIVSLTFFVINLFENSSDWAENPSLPGNDGHIRMNWSLLIFGGDPEISLILIIIDFGVTYVVTVYSIRKWSCEWNEHYKQNENPNS